MTPDIFVALIFGAGIFLGYALAFLYIRIRDGRHSNLKRREAGMDHLIDPHPHG